MLITHQGVRYYYFYFKGKKADLIKLNILAQDCIISKSESELRRHIFGFLLEHEIFIS